jgi:hypothetical protein
VVGKRYRRAIRLWLQAEANWEILDGENPGLDLLDLPPDRLLNYVYVYTLKTFTKEDERMMWETQLDAPFPWEAKNKASDWQTDDDNSFMEAMATMNAIGQG